MVRKIKHYDKPGHQRWLYQLSDMGLVKAIMIIWGICIIVIAIALLSIKVIFSYLK